MIVYIYVTEKLRQSWVGSLFIILVRWVCWWSVWIDWLNELEGAHWKLSFVLLFVCLSHLGSQLADGEAEKLIDDAKFPLLITPEAIFPFSFPAYKSPDTKDDMVRLESELFGTSRKDDRTASGNLKQSVMFVIGWMS